MEAVSIHGRAVAVDDLLGVDDGDLDEFESAVNFEHGGVLESDEEREGEEEVPRPKAKRRSPKKAAFQPTSQPGGVDWRGIPMRYYMGHLVPHFKLVDDKTKTILRTEIEVQMHNLTTLYADIRFRKYPADTDLDIMMHDLISNLDIAAARNAATSWQQTIVGLSAIIETVLVTMGIDKARNLTDSQIRTLPIYQTLILELAMKHKGGAYSVFPTEMKIGMMFTVNVILFVGAQWWLGGGNNKNAEIFESVVGKVYNIYQNMTTPGVQPTAQPPASDVPPIPRPPPPVSSMSDTMAQMATNAAPFLANLRNAFTAAPAPAPARRRAPRRQV